MQTEIIVLTITAASIGFFHTLLGPDHYVPFIIMSKARQWSLFKTIQISALCGFGHIASSILLGFIGILIGISVAKLELLESSRGNIAGWLLIGFGLAYFIWGLRKAHRNKAHTHRHAHEDGLAHAHKHNHIHHHAHVHQKEKSITPWILFTIFVFGPCEPLIPILMYPAAQSSLLGLMVVTSVFAITTLLTMLSIIMISSFGIQFLPLGRLERYSHALAGATIFLCGAGIRFLGL